MSAPEVVIVDGLRTPFVKSGAVFNSVPAYELGRIAVSELLAKTNFDPQHIDETVMGNCGQPAEAANIARVISLNSGIPKQVPAFTVHRNCASGMEAIAHAYLKVRFHHAKVIMAGGTESMSNIPLLFPKRYADFLMRFMRAKNFVQKLSVLTQFRFNYFKPRIALAEGLTDPFCGLNMGQTADLLAREWQISREEQDAFALKSHQKAILAQLEGRLQEEMTPVYVPPDYKKIVKEDVGPRKDQTMAQLQKLRPYFDRHYGTVTVGNSCQVTDGAVAVLVMSEDTAIQKGYLPLAKIRSFAFAGIEPQRMGLGPVIAAKLALQKAGLKLSDMELMELNEAFAAQVLAVFKACESRTFAQRYLNQDEPLGSIDPGVVNVNGGAIALGHPVGASGARIVLTLAKEMKRRGLKYGMAFICIGGGQGGAMILERRA